MIQSKNLYEKLKDLQEYSIRLDDVLDKVYEKVHDLSIHCAGDENALEVIEEIKKLLEDI